MNDQEQVETMQHIILLAALEEVRALRVGDVADNDELASRLVETADSPEHAVTSTVLTFAAVLNDILKAQAEEYLHAILLSDEPSAD